MKTSQTSWPSLSHALGVDIHHNALATKASRRFPHKFGILRAAELIETLSLPALSKVPNVLEGANAPADGQRHEDLFGGAANDIEHDVAPFMAGGNIQKHQFVGPFLLIARAT